jgi:ribonuclease HI
MNHPTPHYLLMTDTSREEPAGHWRFALRPVDGSAMIEVADTEPDTWGERLHLLTVVRALESLDQPSRVTLISCTRYVEQGILYGLTDWRDNQWRWEYFGQMVPVRDADLWQRMDRVLEFHRVECCQRRVDGQHAALVGPHWHLSRTGESWADRIAERKWLKYYVPALAAWCGTLMGTASHCWLMGIRMLAGCTSTFSVHRS